MKYFLKVVVFATLTLSSCSQKGSKDEKKLTENNKTENIVLQMPGKYNKELDAWETNDPKYATHENLDGNIYDLFAFEGEDYTTISEQDKDGNSLGTGLINKKGQIIVQPRYASVTVGFPFGFCEVTDKNNKHGFVSENGIEIVKPQYDCLSLNDKDEMQIDSTMIKVCKNDKEGFINTKGEIVIPIKYKSLVLAGEKLIMFMNEPSKWGFIDYKNKIVIQPEFSHTNIFKEGKMTLQKSDGEEYIVYINGKVEKK
jgi:hypothetical protein